MTMEPYPAGASTSISPPATRLSCAYCNVRQGVAAPPQPAPSTPWPDTQIRFAWPEAVVAAPDKAMATSRNANNVRMPSFPNRGDVFTDDVNSAPDEPTDIYRVNG